MKIYTGTAAGDKFDTLVKHGLGVMISPSPSFKPRVAFAKTFCALDNGAFQCWRRGYPFIEKHFWDTMEDCYRLGITLDFIVIPDIVAGGKASLDFSLKFREDKLSTTTNLALAVQDGIAPKDLDTFDIHGISTIFVGGTEKWKWDTAKSWADYAKAHHRKLHIGRCGTQAKISHASMIGADSVDSTSLARNDSFAIVTEFKKQLELRGIRGYAPPPPCIVNGVIE
jgi:hypothetical protein